MPATHSNMILLHKKFLSVWDNICESHNLKTMKAEQKEQKMKGKKVNFLLPKTRHQLHWLNTCVHPPTRGYYDWVDQITPANFGQKIPIYEWNGYLAMSLNMVVEGGEWMEAVKDAACTPQGYKGDGVWCWGDDSDWEMIPAKDGRLTFSPKQEAKWRKWMVDSRPDWVKRLEEKKGEEWCVKDNNMTCPEMFMAAMEGMEGWTLEDLENHLKWEEEYTDCECY